MLTALKEKIWGILSHKDVSLVMILSPEGEILWRRGRPVTGSSLDAAQGFSISALKAYDSLTRPRLEEESVVQLSGGTLSQSARTLRIKSVLVIPLPEGFCIYIDSGTRERFSDEDITLFRALGDLLSEHLIHIRQSQEMPGGIVGESEAMARVRKQILRYAIEDDPVLLTGETGSGKNHVAELIHQYSGRKGHLVVIHTPSIPETLLESELFGCRKGAYSGASENRKGLVSDAEGGTLFLDEISEIPLSMQARLLAFIERKVYRPVGENRETKADVRIIAASNRVLKNEVAQGRFRQDLFFRLNALPVHIPPLRERRTDISLLVDSFSHLLRGAVLDGQCHRLLESHDWPGNVRELIQVLKRCGVMAADLSPLEALQEILGENEAIPEQSLSLDSAWGAYGADLDRGVTFWQGPWQDFLERRINQVQLHRLLVDRYRQYGSLVKLAESMGISEREYPRFVSALHKYRIHPVLFRD